MMLLLLMISVILTSARAEVSRNSYNECVTSLTRAHKLICESINMHPDNRIITEENHFSEEKNMLKKRHTTNDLYDFTSNDMPKAKNLKECCLKACSMEELYDFCV